MRSPFESSEFASCYPNTSFLPHARVHVERRNLQDGYSDLTSMYPRLITPNLPELRRDFETLKGGSDVTITLVTDPLTVSQADVADLAPDLECCVPFKRHYLIDRTAPLAFSKHHTREVRRACRSGRVDKGTLSANLELWLELYQGLIGRHQINNPFEPTWFRQLQNVPGIEVYTYSDTAGPSAAAIWAIEDDRAYYLFAAAGEQGYRTASMYALIDAVIVTHPEVRVFDLGGNPGDDDPRHGLSSFKSGFSNRTGTSYLIGKILNSNRYSKLAENVKTDFFPAYRHQ